jgi:type IV secretory pathway VirB10-like protein
VGTSPTSTSPVATTTPTATGSHISLSTSAIIGICVGGCFVLSLLVAMLRKCKPDPPINNQQPYASNNLPQQSSPSGYPSPLTTYNKAPQSPLSGYTTPYVPPSSTPLTASALGERERRRSIELRPWDSVTQVGSAASDVGSMRYGYNNRSNYQSPHRTSNSTAYTGTVISSVIPTTRPDLGWQ